MKAHVFSLPLYLPFLLGHGERYRFESLGFRDGSCTLTVIVEVHILLELSSRKGKNETNATVAIIRNFGIKFHKGVFVASVEFL
jgi:hypothetical protein